MGVLNFLRKKKKDDREKIGDQDKKAVLDQALGMVDTSSMSMAQKVAFKVFQKMPAKKQEEMIRKALNPQNIQKEKEKILAQLKEAVRSGQISQAQAEQIKSQLGLR